MEPAIPGTRLRRHVTRRYRYRVISRIVGESVEVREVMLPARPVATTAGDEGPDRVVVADIEAGRKGASGRSPKALAAALGVAIDDLV